jgi:micrococcal nuclease
VIGRSPAARLSVVVVGLLLLGVLVVVAALLQDPPAVAPGMEGERARVERVVDGDTLVVRVDGRTDRVRHIGIDAPELDPVECHAVEALRHHERLVEGVELRLERDGSDRDRFGRLLRHAWLEVGGSVRHVGEELVAAGAARARSYPPDTGMDRRLRAAEDHARREGAGMWGACDAGATSALVGGR